MDRTVITYRELSPDEVRSRILEINVSEHGEVVYHWVGRELRAVPEAWDRPRWTRASCKDETWWGLLGRVDVRAWGAFAGDRLVGLIIYRPRLTERIAQLAALFVSTDCRRQGIAARLTSDACRQAKADGHAWMYVSSTPSESAVGFYRSQGFTPTLDVHPDLYELEPEDIHMIKVL